MGDTSQSYEPLQPEQVLGVRFEGLGVAPMPSPLEPRTYLSGDVAFSHRKKRVHQVLLTRV
jgi:hypothetical protein